MAKLTLLIGAGIGYVLGTRAGRERYEEIVTQARRVWRDPRVQKKAAQAQDAAREAAATGQDAVTTATQKASDSVGGSSQDPTPPTSTDTGTGPAHRAPGV